MRLTSTIARIAALRPQREPLTIETVRTTTDIFISHAMPEDEALAARLDLALEAARYRVWRAARIRGGEVAHLAIRQALKSSRAVIVLWTPRSIELEWVYSEATLAHAARKLVPLRTAEVDHFDIPQPFNTVQTLEIDDMPGLVAALANLGIEPEAVS